MLWKETLLFLYGSQFKVYCLCLILEFTTWCDDVCGGQFFDNKLLSIMLWNCDNWLFCLSCSDMTHTLNTSLFVHNCHLSPVSIQTQSLALESSQSWLPLLRPSILLAAACSLFVLWCATHLSELQSILLLYPPLLLSGSSNFFGKFPIYFENLDVNRCIEDPSEANWAILVFWGCTFVIFGG